MTDSFPVFNGNFHSVFVIIVPVWLFCLRDFHWSPSDNYIAYWTPEDKDTPARVTIMEMPNRKEIRVKNLFNVSDVSKGYFLSSFLLINLFFCFYLPNSFPPFSVSVSSIFPSILYYQFFSFFPPSLLVLPICISFFFAFSIYSL